MYRSKNLPIQRSTDPAIYRYIDLPIRRSSDLQIHRSTDPVIYRYINLPILRSTDPAIYRSSHLEIHRSTYRSSDVQIHRSTDPSIYRSSNLQMQRSIHPTTYRSIDLPIQRSNDTSIYPSFDRYPVVSPTNRVDSPTSYMSVRLRVRCWSFKAELLKVLVPCIIPSILSSMARKTTR